MVCTSSSWGLGVRGWGWAGKICLAQDVKSAVSHDRTSALYLAWTTEWDPATQKSKLEMNRKTYIYLYGWRQHRTPRGFHSEHNHVAGNLRADVCRKIHMLWPQCKDIFLCWEKFRDALFYVDVQINMLTSKCSWAKAVGRRNAVSLVPYRMDF